MTRKEGKKRGKENSMRDGGKNGRRGLEENLEKREEWLIDLNESLRFNL